MIVPLSYLKDRGRSMVLAVGCFDAVHYGHLLHFRAAKETGLGEKLGTILVVAVTADRRVGKGLGRPVFGENERMEMVNALRPVDYVVLNEHPNAVPIIEELRPAFYAKGGEYAEAMTEALAAEKAAVEGYGGKFFFTTEKTWHSTDILRTLLTC